MDPQVGGDGSASAHQSKFSLSKMDGTVGGK